MNQTEVLQFLSSSGLFLAEKWFIAAMLIAIPFAKKLGDAELLRVTAVLAGAYSLHSLVLADVYLQSGTIIAWYGGCMASEAAVIALLHVTSLWQRRPAGRLSAVVYATLFVSMLNHFARMMERLMVGDDVPSTIYPVLAQAVNWVLLAAVCWTAAVLWKKQGHGKKGVA